MEIGKKSSGKQVKVTGPCGEIVHSKACKKARGRCASHCAGCHHNQK